MVGHADMARERGSGKWRMGDVMSRVTNSPLKGSAAVRPYDHDTTTTLILNKRRCQKLDPSFTQTSADSGCPKG